jgi:hypothetical protein
MNLAELQLYGAVLNAGFLDVRHDGTMKRLAEVLPSGDLVMFPDGDAFVRDVMFQEKLAVMKSEDSKPEDVAPAGQAPVVPAKKVAAKKTAAKKEAAPAEPGSEEDLAALDALIGGADK